jgi:hypothetical protein
MKLNQFTCFIFIVLVIFSCQNKPSDFVCTPCDLECDSLTFDEPGTCPHCNMPLVRVSEIQKQKSLVLNQIDIREGSGVFLIEGGKGNEEKSIQVFYHRPSNFSKDSKILLVIPGAGRNGDSYRDAWIPESEKYNVLILSPMYSEDQYLFEEYHLGGTMKGLNLEDAIEAVPNTNEVKLDEENFKFQVNLDRETWIFEDFDRVFELAKEATGAEQPSYDIFGHSAGGQILHRLAIFKPSSKADLIIAGNSGFFTLPDSTIGLPFGTKELPLSIEGLKTSFRQNLILLLGESDNEEEPGGTMLRSPTADLQGIGRLAGGNYFFTESKKMADEINAEFNWKLEIVPNVGHDHEKMGDAAAKILYR